MYVYTYYLITLTLFTQKSNEEKKEIWYLYNSE